jgi:membrane protein required for colicin V production
LVPEYLIEKGTAAFDQTMKTLQDGKAATDTINKVNPENGTTDGTSGGSGSETPGPAPAPSGDTGGTQGSNANPQGNPDGQQGGTGYKDAQRNDLNRLIESSQQ